MRLAVHSQGQRMPKSVAENSFQSNLQPRKKNVTSRTAATIRNATTASERRLLLMWPPNRRDSRSSPPFAPQRGARIESGARITRFGANF